LRLKKIIGEDSARYSNNEMKEPIGSLNFSLESGDTRRIFLEKFKKTITIRIKGKNVNDLDLEKQQFDSASQ
jgi:hypothetical protein